MRYLICLLTLSSLSGCINFRVSDKEAMTELVGEGVEPIFEDLVIDNQNIHFVYTDQSQHSLAIFIHGSPGSWNAFIDYFKADSLLNMVDVLAIDRPGFGNSGYGKAEPSLEKQAYYLHEVSKKFSHPSKILIGHSLGGPVIARMAMDYPNEYDGLVFVAASIDPEMEKDEWYRDIINTRFGGFLTPKDFEVSNDEILPLKDELEKMIPLWEKIRTSSIIIHGTRDSLVPVENVDFAVRMLEDSLTEIQLLDNVDHFIPWTHPHTIIGAIRRMADVQ